MLNTSGMHHGTIEELVAAKMERDEEEKESRSAVDLGRFLARSKEGVSKFKMVDMDHDAMDLRITYKLFQRMKHFVGKKKTPDQFVSLGGYSYIRGANHNFGSSSHYTAFLSHENYLDHAECVICKKQRTTTVNGICLACSKN